MIAATGLRAGDGAREVKEAGQTYIDLDNGLIALRIAPERGARIIRFTPKFSGKNWVHPEPTYGMALDHFAGQGFPGELDKATYQHRVLPDYQAGGVELWARTAQGTRAVPAGIELRKRITLAPGTDTVAIGYTLANTTTNAFRVAFMPKFDVFISGDRAENYYYRPSAKGLDIAWPGEVESKDHGDHYLKNPISGWTAALNRKTREGLAFVMDYNYLQWFYNCLPYNTVEWLYAPVSLQPGASWKTEVKLVPFHGLTNITFASANLIADTEVAVAAGGVVSVQHHLRAAEGALTGVKLKTRLRQIATLKEYAFPEAEAKQIGAEPSTVTTSQTIHEDSGLTATIQVAGRKNGQSFSEEYDYYHRGVKGGGFDLLASSERGYTKTPPRKIKKFADPAGLTFAPEKPPTIFEMRGLYGKLYRSQEAAEKVGMKMAGIGYARASWDGHSVSAFPFDFKELFKFSVIIINNIDGTAVDDEMQFMLRHYVHSGGGLLLLGGYYGFGAGGWNELDDLKELFPIRVKGPFDLKPAPEPGVITDGAGPLYNAKDFSGTVQIRWLHDVELKPGAQIEASVDKFPFTVTGQYGQGRVAAVCGTVLGTPTKDHELFWQQSEWPTILGKLLNWLAAEKSQ
ncbi:MAG: hypothetical protein HY360_19930 [Verrucomicrobia bacterium]|nr:hypothetical protein [Verrucomicrobiota bacterium]